MMRRGMPDSSFAAPRRRGMCAEPEEGESVSEPTASRRGSMFSVSEPQKVPLPQDELYQYRVKNTFIDSFEDEEEETPIQFGMKSCPAGIWKNAFIAQPQQPFVKAPMKVALDHGGGRSPTLSPAPPRLHLGASSMAQEPPRSPVPPGLRASGAPGLLAPPLAAGAGGPVRPRSPVAPGQWNGPMPQVKLGQPSVVNMSWSTYAEASHVASSASPRRGAVPSRAPGWSQGSALHESGGCEPCAWFWKPAGCRNAADCKRCHLCEEGALKHRKKAKVAMMRTKIPAEAEDGCATASTTGCVSVSPTAATDGAASQELAPARASAPQLPTQLQGAPPEQPQVQPQADAAEPAAPAEQQENINFGSRLHMTGECEPCAWFWRPTGCSHGIECRRCHLCPEGEVKARKKKKLALLRRSREDGATTGEASISVACEESD